MAALAVPEPGTIDIAGAAAADPEPETATVEAEPAPTALETPADAEPVAPDADVDAGGEVVAHLSPREAAAAPEQPE